MPSPTVAASSQGWASVANRWVNVFNGGWIADEIIGSTGGLTAPITPSSSSLQFYSTGDATGFYLPGRPVRVVQGATTLYCETVSSSCSATSTIVTLGKFLNSTGLSTGAITSVSVSPVFPSTGGGAGNAPNDYGHEVMIRNWGL